MNATTKAKQTVTLWKLLLAINAVALLLVWIADRSETLAFILFVGVETSLVGAFLYLSAGNVIRRLTKK